MPNEAERELIMKLEGTMELLAIDEQEGSGKNDGKTFYHVVVKTGKEIWELFATQEAYNKLKSLPALTKISGQIDATKYSDKVYLRLNDATVIK
jgi:hypothetical protein